MKLRSAFILQVFGALTPALVLFVSIPIIRNQLDLESFAAFTVLVSAVGLLALLDGGLGRASTYFVSLALAGTKRYQMPGVFQAVLLVGLVFSFILGVLAAIALQWVQTGAIANVRPALQILAIFAPFFVASSLLRGVLEAQQHFGRSNTLQIMHGVLIGAAPVLIFLVTTSLELFAWVVGAIRIGYTLALAFSAGLMSYSGWGWTQSVWVHVRQVFHYTKWLFVSNIIGIAIVFADRYVVASFFPSNIVAAYVLPMEMIMRAQILVAAFCTVIFPRLVTSSASLPSVTVRPFLANMQGIVTSITLIVGSVMGIFAEPLMRLWLGNALASEGAQVVIAGIIGLGLIASAALAMIGLNSEGFTRPVALLHLAEMPVYFMLLYMVANFSSLELLLTVWIIRLLADAIGMNLLADWNSVAEARQSATVAWLLMLASLAGLLLMAFLLASLDLPTRIVIAVVGSAVGIVSAHYFIGRFQRSVSALRNMDLYG